MRAPAAVLTEIAWRWTFGLAFWAILYYSFREYFASVDISNAEYAALRSLEPYTWIAITARLMIAIGMGLRLIGPVVIPALIILWTALATIGRAATIRALDDTEPRTNWFSTAALHLFRVGLGMASLLAYFGCGALIDAAVGDPSQHLGAVIVLSSLALLAVVFIWSFANWFLSLATIFSVVEGRGSFGSLGETSKFYREYSGRLVGTGAWFAFARSVLVIATSSISLWLFSEANPRLAIPFIILVSLVYFAMADALNIWRLATYISFTEPEPAPPVIVAPKPVPLPTSEPELSPRAEASAESSPPVIPAEQATPSDQS